MAVYNIHGGHNPSGKIACGASDLLDESREDRKKDIRHIIVQLAMELVRRTFSERSVLSATKDKQH